MIKIGEIEYRETKEQNQMSENVSDLLAIQKDVGALTGKLGEIEKAVSILKDTPDATNSIGQIMNRLEKMEERMEEMQDVLAEALPVVHDHEQQEGLSPEMKFAVLDFLKEVDGMAATDDEFATNPDGTPKREKKKDVRNTTDRGAEVDQVTEDPEEVKFLALERKVDALMKVPNYRGADVDRTTGEECGTPNYMAMVLKAHEVS
jgi:hypothetical protein